MLTEKVVEHFGTQKAVADALEITQPSVAEWGLRPPLFRQLQLEIITRGKLKAEKDALPTLGSE